MAEPDVDSPAAQSATRRSRVGDPAVWLILSDKAGDNAQVTAIAEALPWRSETKRMTVMPRYALGKPAIAPSLHHIDAAHSDPLQPPWPDLVIAIGRRMSMVALWIKERSQNRTKIVLLGTPKRFPERFDLAVITEQYRPSPRPNFLRINYPLQRIDKAAIDTEAAAWRSELGALQCPLIAAMIGGVTKAVRFDAAVATQLAADLSACAEAMNGSLFVTTSRRTPPEVVAVLERQLPPGAVLHRWNADQPRNPYLALLGIADRFIITSDSLSMQMEVARLGRPLAIYPLPPSSLLAAGPLSSMVEGRFRFTARLQRVVGNALDRIGAMRHHRDLTAIPRRLVKDGYAVWFGSPFPSEGAGPGNELAQVVARTVALLDDRSPAPRAT